MSLRHAVLGTLARVPASGYDLLKRFDKTYNFVWWASHGAVYTELQRLVAEGLLRVEDAGARGRRTHHVTPAGVEHLREWLRTPAARRPRDELVLRVFQLWLLEPEEASGYLELVAEEHRGRLAEYEERASGAELDPSRPEQFYDLLALRAGIANERAMCAWASDAAADVRRLRPRGPERA